MISRQVDCLYNFAFNDILNGYAGSSAYRTYVPAFLPASRYTHYSIPRMNMDIRSPIPVKYRAIELLNLNFQNWKFAIRTSTEEAQVCKIPGMLYELNDKVFIHILIARNVGNEEDFRIYMSYDFMTKPIFKTAYKRFMNGGFVRPTDTIVITNDIVSLFFDKAVLPKFKSLEDMVSYKRDILKMVSGNAYNEELVKLIE